MPAHTHPLALVPYSAQEEKTAPGSLHLHPDALKTGQRQAGSGQETEQEKRTMHGLHLAGSPEKWVPTLAPGASWPLSPRDKDQTVTWFLDKNTGMGCPFLLQGIFLTQESNLCLLGLLHWQVDP